MFFEPTRQKLMFCSSSISGQHASRRDCQAGALSCREVEPTPTARLLSTHAYTRGRQDPAAAAAHIHPGCACQKHPSTRTPEQQNEHSPAPGNNMPRATVRGTPPPPGKSTAQKKAESSRSAAAAGPAAALWTPASSGPRRQSRLRQGKPRACFRLFGRSAPGPLRSTCRGFFQRHCASVISLLR